MFQVCEKLGEIVSHVSPKISFCCSLTVFSLQPSDETMQIMLDAYQHKSKAGTKMKKCCSNCASDKGDCLKEKDNDQVCGH